MNTITTKTIATGMSPLANSQGLSGERLKPSAPPRERVATLKTITNVTSSTMTTLSTLADSSTWKYPKPLTRAQPASDQSHQGVSGPPKPEIREFMVTPVNTYTPASSAR